MCNDGSDGDTASGVAAPGVAAPGDGRAEIRSVIGIMIGPR